MASLERTKDGAAGFLEGEDGHEDGEEKKSAIAEDGHAGERLGLGETATVDVQVKSIGADNAGEETADDERDDGGPNAELPANEKEKANGNFGEGQGLGDEERGPRGKHLVGIDLESEERKRDGNGRTRMHVRAKQLGVAGIDENGRENDTADPDDEAAVIERGGLHHEVSTYF